jgi:trehalose 6-phosphate phosphatase
MVVNVAPSGAQDKAAAVRSLLARCSADRALYAGDDLNDEPVFEAAPPEWLTIRVGRFDRRSRAMYYLDSPIEIAMLLERMLVLLQAARQG